jgi:hypothetical protein
LTISSKADLISARLEGFILTVGKGSEASWDSDDESALALSSPTTDTVSGLTFLGAILVGTRRSMHVLDGVELQRGSLESASKKM